MSEFAAPIWSAPLVVRDTSGNAPRMRRPSTFAAGDEVMMAWVPAVDTPAGIVWSIYDPAVGRWSPQVLALDATGQPLISLGDVSLTTLGGKVVMAWTAKNRQMAWSTFDTKARRWSNPEIAGSFTGPSKDHVFTSGIWNDSPAITETYGRLFLAWAGDDGKIRYSLYDPDTKAWDPAKECGPANEPLMAVAGPAVVGLANKVFLTWQATPKTGKGNEHILYSVYDVVAGTWTSPKLASDPRHSSYSTCAFPSVVVYDQTRVLVTWPGSNNHLWQSTYDVESDQWGDQSAIDGSDFHSELPTGLVNMGDLYLMTWVAGTEFKFATSNGIGFATADWMRSIRESMLYRVRSTLAQLAIPGSHDAGMYSGLLGISKLYKTQDHDLYEQLIGGVRYFDLRVEVEADDTNYHFYHFWDGPTVEEGLQSVRKFMERPRCEEVVILKFSHYSKMTQKGFDGLITRIVDALSPWLYENKTGERLAQVPLGTFSSDGKGKVIIVYDGDFTTTQKGIYRYRDAATKCAQDQGRPADPAQGDLRVWDCFADTTDLATMTADQYKKFDDYTGKCDGTEIACDLFLLSWTLTPVVHVWDEAQIANGALPGQYATLLGKSTATKVANIIFVDYYEYSGVTQLCWSLNTHLTSEQLKKLWPGIVSQHT